MQVLLYSGASVLWLSVVCLSTSHQARPISTHKVHVTTKPDCVSWPTHMYSEYATKIREQNPTQAVRWTHNVGGVDKGNQVLQPKKAGTT